jgi:hypothetical protein
VGHLERFNLATYTADGSWSMVTFHQSSELELQLQFHDLADDREWEALGAISANQPTLIKSNAKTGADLELVDGLEVEPTPENLARVGIDPLSPTTPADHFKLAEHFDELKLIDAHISSSGKVLFRMDESLTVVKQNTIFLGDLKTRVLWQLKPVDPTWNGHLINGKPQRFTYKNGANELELEPPHANLKQTITENGKETVFEYAPAQSYSLREFVLLPLIPCEQILTPPAGRKQ